MSIEFKEVAAALHGMVDDHANNKVSMFYRVFPIKANEPRTKLELRRWNYYVKSTKPHGPGDLKHDIFLNTSGSRNKALRLQRSTKLLSR